MPGTISKLFNLLTSLCNSVNIRHFLLISTTDIAIKMQTPITPCLLILLVQNLKELSDIQTLLKLLILLLLPLPFKENLIGKYETVHHYKLNQKHLRMNLKNILYSNNIIY